jgi:hypothetical protein
MLDDFLKKRETLPVTVKKIAWGQYTIGSQNRLNLRTINGRLVGTEISRNFH